MADNLVQRGGMWHVRLDIPKDVQAVFGNRKVLTQSLKTGSRAEAMRLRLPWLTQWKAEIHAARERKKSQADAWRLTMHEEGQLVQDERSRWITALYTPSVKNPSTEVNLVSLAEGAHEAFSALVNAGHHELASRLNKWLQGIVDAAEQGVDHAKAIALLNELITIEAEVDVLIAEDDFSLSTEEVSEARNIILNPSYYKPKSPITRQMLDSWGAHLETQIDTAKTRDRLKQSVQRFSDYLSKEGLPLTFDTVHGFLETLSPARQTRANYLWAGRTFWKWANKYNVAFREKFNNQPCPFDGHELPKTGEAAGRKRLAYTKEQVEQLHGQALDKGNIVLSCLIKFGAYTGARLEEIGRIRPEHTIFDNGGEPIGFKITESKTDAGVREMPLHPKLVPLYKELCSKAQDNDGYLFPGGHNKYGNRLDGLSKQFGRLKSKSLGKDYTFHSIRHTVTTILHQQGVSIEVLPYILGHETGAFTLSQYSKGPSFNQKMECIGLLDYDFK